MRDTITATMTGSAAADALHPALAGDLPFAEDLVEAMAMRLWREAAWQMIPGMARRDQPAAKRIALSGDFYQLGAYEQSMLRHWARSLLSIATAAIEPAPAARIGEIWAHLETFSTPDERAAREHVA